MNNFLKLLSISIIASLGLSMFQAAFAHEQLELQIEEYSKLITEDESNAELYLSRGEVYYHHNEPEKARADYQRALELDPKLYEVFAKQAELLLSENKYQEALELTDKFLEHEKDDSHGLNLRAKSLLKLNRKVEAANAYTYQAKLSPDNHPQFYLEYARALEGSSEHGVDDAIAMLKKRMAEHVTLTVYETEITDMLVRNNKLNEAIKWIETLIPKQKRPEFLMYRKVELLEDVGKKDDATKIVEDINQVLAKYPAHIKDTPSMAQFIDLLNQKLGKMN